MPARQLALTVLLGFTNRTTGKICAICARQASISPSQPPPAATVCHEASSAMIATSVTWGVQPHVRALLVSLVPQSTVQSALLVLLVGSALRQVQRYVNSAFQENSLGQMLLLVVWAARPASLLPPLVRLRAKHVQALILRVQRRQLHALRARLESTLIPKQLLV